MSRQAYRNHYLRVYYPCQVSSKNDYYNDRYWKTDKLLKEIQKPVKSHYRGKKTKVQKRFEYLKKQLNFYDEMRFVEFESILQKMYSKSNYSEHS